MSAERMLSQEQIDHLSTLCFINSIDSHLNIVSGVKVFINEDGRNVQESRSAIPLLHTPQRILLKLEIFYDGEKIEEMSFNLHNYDYEDIVYIARNVRSNEFILQEVDNLLAGDIE